MNTLHHPTWAHEMWKIYGSIGMAKEPLSYAGDCFTANGNGYRLEGTRKKHPSGITVQTAALQNTADTPITLSDVASRFVLDGGEYEVYTQSNTWQNESTGTWSPLVTEIRAESDGLRCAFGAAPFLALWNKQTKRGIVFHILSRAPWYLSARLTPHFGGEAVTVWVEAGYNPTHFSRTVNAKEAFSLPDVLFYEFRNKTDLDAYKLHRYMNDVYPRRVCPVIYNTWLYKFEQIDFENVSSQIERAAELGVDYFVTDAAWYGEGNFWDARGDWTENKTGAYAGKMKELAERVRATGMQFGLWLELESAGPASYALREHPEYYFTYTDKNDTFYFLDFASSEACDFLFACIDRLITEYGVRFLKLDFNQDLRFDRMGDGFIRHLEGYERFLLRLKSVHPLLYIEDCSGGGHRMSLSNMRVADSFWLSDNQGAYEGIRIFRDTVKRLPPQAIEKWASIRSLSNVTPIYMGADTAEKILTCNDATWNDVRGLHPSYLEAFLFGGPIGFSCDLNTFSQKLVDRLKVFIARYHEMSSFWLSAECRILAETPSVTVLQFSDAAFTHIEIVAVAERIRQSTLTVYPVLDTNASYMYADRLLSGAEIDDGGIALPFTENYSAKFITLDKK